MRIRIIPGLLLSALLICSSAQAEDVKTQEGNADSPAPEPRRLNIPGEESIRKLAAPARGNLNAEELQALQKANADTAIERGKAPPQAVTPPPPQSQTGKKSTKAMYGDIIIYK